MAECRKCGVDITWAKGPEGQIMSLDNVAASLGDHRFALDYEEGAQLPTAVPIPADRAASGYRAHEFTCGAPQ